MKKNILKATLFVAIALVAGYNVHNSQTTEGMSDLQLANIEALANFEMNPKDCDPRLNEECGVINTTPNGSWAEIYYEQINKFEFLPD